MDVPGYESDKNDIMVEINGAEVNLTGHWDGTVNSFKWSHNGKSIFFLAPTAILQNIVIEKPWLIRGSLLLSRV